jgi:hypothetical protein
MEERRKDLRLRWQDVAERSGLSLKTLHSVRSSDRRVAELTKTGIEDGLRWEHGSVDLILSGGSPAPASVVAEETPAAPPDRPVPPIAMDKELEQAAAPYIGRFGPDRLKAVADGWDPPGGQLFDPGSWEAQTWERMRRSWPDPWRRLWLIAATLGTENKESARQHGAAAGLKAAAGTSGGAA